MLNIDSIANKFRLSYFIFALLLCAAFVSIFLYAESRIEQDLVKARLLQQLELSQEKYGDQPIYVAEPGIKIYRYDKAPISLQAIANDTVQETSVTVNKESGGRSCQLASFRLHPRRSNLYFDLPRKHRNGDGKLPGLANI